MLNYLWGIMILLGLGFGIVTGEVEALSNATIESAGEAVTLSVTMLGIMSMWTGLMEVARQAGLMDRLTGWLRPVLRFLFPRIPVGHPAEEFIAANIVANLLGLGWAATPVGLKAMKELAGLERIRIVLEKRGYTGKNRELKELPASVRQEIEREAEEIQCKKASDEMCTFLVLNISSLQLIPVSVISYRARYGAVNPAAVVFPGLIATLISTLVAVLFCRVMSRKRGHNYDKIKP